MSEFKPDIDSSCKRYSHITLGDDREYRVAHLAFGPRGDRMRDALNAMDEARINENPSVEDVKKFNEASVSLLTDALGVFYSKETIDYILENQLFSHEHIGLLIIAVHGDTQKKRLMEENSTIKNSES